MKVLWVCNKMIDSVTKVFNNNVSISAGWIDGLFDEIVNENTVELSICFPMKNKNIISGKIGKVKYYSFYQKKNIADIVKSIELNKLTEKHIKKILTIEKPDILHVFGTEFSHSLQAIKIFGKPERSLISIQGIISVIAEHYYSDLPSNVINKINLSSCLRGNISRERKINYLRGENEKNAIKSVGYISGRTDWDRICSQSINDLVKYRFCNENLRSCFYDNEKDWKYSLCEKHTIFISQSSYPIKGLHYLLKALPIILKKFPDTRVYVAGNSPIKTGSLINRLSISPYGSYLFSILKKEGLIDNIIFLGKLNAKDMKNQYLKANVYVLCSSIENSPNSLGEAMILGTPCIASNVGGVSSMLTNNIEGYLYQHNEYHLLAFYIIKVFESEKCIEDISIRARERAKKTHDKAVNCKAMLEIYDEIIKN